jgi:hypothetical protein
MDNEDKAPESNGKIRHPPLKNIGDVKREMARLYWSAKNSNIVISDASKLANILSLMGRMIADSDLEDRITAIEAAQGGNSR